MRNTNKSVPTFDVVKSDLDADILRYAATLITGDNQSRAFERGRLITDGAFIALAKVWDETARRCYGNYEKMFTNCRSFLMVHVRDHYKDAFLPGERVAIPAGQVEFDVAGNTIWVQGASGGTLLRIKCTGNIIVETCSASPDSHADLEVDGDIKICLSADAKTQHL